MCASECYTILFDPRYHNLHLAELLCIEACCTEQLVFVRACFCVLRALTDYSPRRGSGLLLLITLITLTVITILMLVALALGTTTTASTLLVLQLYQSVSTGEKCLPIMYSETRLVLHIGILITHYKFCYHYA
jgi:hypothetical protein